MLRKLHVKATAYHTGLNDINKPPTLDKIIAILCVPRCAKIVEICAFHAPASLRPSFSHLTPRRGINIRFSVRCRLEPEGSRHLNIRLGRFFFSRCFDFRRFSSESRLQLFPVSLIFSKFCGVNYFVLLFKVVRRVN